MEEFQTVPPPLLTQPVRPSEGIIVQTLRLTERLVAEIHQYPILVPAKVLHRAREPFISSECDCIGVHGLVSGIRLAC
jgi:hypothetical protein